MTVLRKSFYIHWSAGRSPRVHEVNPGRDPSCIIGIIKTNHLKSVSMPICQHEILGTLKIPQNFLTRFPMALTRITQVPTQHANNKRNIRVCAYLSIHQVAHNLRIKDCFHLISLNIIMRTLVFGKYVTLYNRCLTKRT